jgi:1-acyl-sn-glycerol-3-phosphate acyltransferase
LKNKDEASVLVFNHCSNIEALVATAYCPVTPKYIFKRELVWMLPALFVLALGMGHVAINRSDRTRAYKSLDNATNALRRGRSIGIFPEGTRSASGKLQSFKRGAFYLSQAADAPVTPGVFNGTFLLWPLHRIFAYAGHVHLRFLKPLRFGADVPIDERLERTHQVMNDAVNKQRKLAFDDVVRLGASTAAPAFIFVIGSSIYHYLVVYPFLLSLWHLVF